MLYLFIYYFQSCLCCCCSQSKSLVTSVPMNGTSIQWKNQELNNHNTDRSSHKDSINWKLRTLTPFQNETGKEKSLQSYYNRKSSERSIMNSAMCTIVPNSRGDWVDGVGVTVMFCELRSTGSTGNSASVKDIDVIMTPKNWLELHRWFCSSEEGRNCPVSVTGTMQSFYLIVT